MNLSIFGSEWEKWLNAQNLCNQCFGGCGCFEYHRKCFLSCRTEPYRHLNTPTKLFLKSLTIADLCMGLFSTSPHAINSAIGHDLSEVSEKYCLITNMASTVFYIASTVSLLLVNIDRYLAIEFPLKYMKIVTIRKARSMLFCLWSFNCVVLLTLALLFSQGTFKHSFESCGPFIDDLIPNILYLYQFTLVCLR